MNTAETVLTITEAGAFAFACLAVAREAVKRPWIKFSWSASVSILPPEKRQPPQAAPAATNPAAGAADSAPVPAAVPERRAA